MTEHTLQKQCPSCGYMDNLHSEHCTMEYAPEGYFEMPKIEQMREIVNGLSYHMIGGVLIDLQSANVYVKVYNACNDKQKEILGKLSLVQGIKFCWKCVK